MRFHTRINSLERKKSELNSTFFFFLRCDKLFRVKNMMFGFCRMNYDIFIIKTVRKLLYHHWKLIQMNQMMANWINLNSQSNNNNNSSQWHNAGLRLWTESGILNWLTELKYLHISRIVYGLRMMLNLFSTRNILLNFPFKSHSFSE